jgi:hypothetical protein
MATKYYVGLKQRTNAIHPVHTEGCPFIPEKEKRIYLGEFRSAQEAILEGRHYFSMADGCPFCCKKQDVHEKISQISRVYHELIPVNLHIPVSFHQSMLCCLS